VRSPPSSEERFGSQRSHDLWPSRTRMGDITLSRRPRSVSAKMAAKSSCDMSIRRWPHDQLTIEPRFHLLAISCQENAPRPKISVYKS
jgi:hypothetical protein